MFIWKINIGPTTTFGQKGTSFFYAFIRFRTFQNVKIHKKKFIWVYHPPKNLYFWPQLGEGGRGRHFVVGTTQKYKFFFDVAPN